MVVPTSPTATTRSVLRKPIHSASQLEVAAGSKLVVPSEMLVPKGRSKAPKLIAMRLSARLLIRLWISV